jgi:protein phosphatase-4 regulatory subunit 3
MYNFSLLTLSDDPDYPKNLKHREFMKKKIIFKEVVPFNNPEVVKKIHQTFRIQYLKDVALPRILDDATFATLNSLIYLNQVEILDWIQRDEKYLDALFSAMKEPSTPFQKLKDMALFLSEICQIARSLQMQSRSAFYQYFTSYINNFS